MPTIDDDLAESLNTLLEDERASIEMEVAFAMGATEYREREALRLMGCEDIGTCVQIHEWLERAEIPISRRINGVALHVLNMDRYDERLRAFALHQLATAERASPMLDAVAPDLRGILENLQQLHARHMAWCERRAGEFAASRTMEFSPAGRPLAPEPESSGEQARAGAAWEPAEDVSNGNHLSDGVTEEARALLRQDEQAGPQEDVGPETPPDLA